MSATSPSVPVAVVTLSRYGVRRNLVSTVVGNVVFSGSQFLITIALARLGGISDLGQYALGLAWCTPIFAFTGLQMRAVQATDCRGRFQFADYLRVRLAGTAFAIIAILAVSVLASWSRGILIVVLAVACTKAADSLSDLLYGLLQLHERLDLIARGMSVRASVGVLALVIAVGLTHNVVIGLFSLALGWLIVLFTYEWPMTLRVGAVNRCDLVRFRFTGSSGRLTLLCLPLALVALVLNSAFSIPRVMLEHTAGEQSLGLFSAVATISAGIGLLYSAVGQTALPRLAKTFMSDRQRFDTAVLRMMLFSIALGCLVVLGAWLWGAKLVGLFYGHQAQTTSGLVAGLVTVGVLSNTASLLGAGLTASQRFWSQFSVSCFTLVVTAAACNWLIPAMGATGAMYATLAGATVQVVAYGFVCRRA